MVLIQMITKILSPWHVHQRSLFDWSYVVSSIPSLMLIIDSMHSHIYLTNTGLYIAVIYHLFHGHLGNMIGIWFEPHVLLVHSWSLNSYPHCTNCAGMQSHGSVVKLLKEVCLAACSITDNEVYYSFINTSSSVASSTFFLWVLTCIIAFDLGQLVHECKLLDLQGQYATL